MICTIQVFFHCILCYAPTAAGVFFLPTINGNQRLIMYAGMSRINESRNVNATAKRFDVIAFDRMAE